MRKEKSASQGFVHMGTISLLTVLLVVMMVVLSLLVLSAARQDYDYSLRLAQRKTAYFEAHNQAWEILSQVEQRLEQPEPDFTGLPVTVTGEEITWEVPLGEDQTLKAAITYRQGQTQITCWQVR